MQLFIVFMCPKKSYKNRGFFSLAFIYLLCKLDSSNNYLGLSSDNNNHFLKSPSINDLINRLNEN